MSVHLSAKMRAIVSAQSSAQVIENMNKNERMIAFNYKLGYTNLLIRLVVLFSSAKVSTKKRHSVLNV